MRSHFLKRRSKRKSRNPCPNSHGLEKEACKARSTDRAEQGFASKPYAIFPYAPLLSCNLLTVLIIHLPIPDCCFVCALLQNKVNCDADSSRRNDNVLPRHCTVYNPRPQCGFQCHRPRRQQACFLHCYKSFGRLCAQPAYIPHILPEKSPLYL